MKKQKTSVSNFRCLNPSLLEISIDISSIYNINYVFITNLDLWVCTTHLLPTWKKNQKNFNIFLTYL